MKCKIKGNYEFVFWSICYAGLFVLITYINFTKFAHMNNSDASSEMFEYMKAVFENKSIIPENWYNSNELLARRNVYTAIPIYMLTKDLLLTFKINTIITNVILSFSFIFFVSKSGVKKKYIPMALFLFTGLFSFNLPDDQLLFFFMQAYAIYAAIIFITLGIVISTGHKLKKVFGYFFCCLTALLMGMIGPKMLLLFYVPLAFVSFIEYLIEYFKTVNLINKYFYRLFYTLSILAFNCIGLIIYAAFYSKYTSSEYYSLSFKPIGIVVTEFYKQIVALLEILDIRSNGIMKSAMGLNEMYSIVLLLLGIIALVYVYKISKNREGKFGLFVLLSSIAISLMAMGLASFEISQRFYFLAPITVVIGLVLFYQMVASTKYKALRISLALILLGGVASNVITYYRPMLNGFIEERKQYLMAESGYLQQQGYNTIFATRWNANILSGYSNGVLDTAVIVSDTFRPYKFLTNLDRYEVTEDVIFSISDDEIMNIYKENSNSIKCLNGGKKIKKIGDINLYYFRKNPIKKFEFPENIGDSIEYPLNHIDCEVINGKYDLATGNIISNNFNGGCVIAGPNIDVDEGNYRLKLSYHTKSDIEDCGEIYVTANLGAEIKNQATLKNYESYVVIENLEFDKDEDIEIKIYNNKDVKIIIEQIIIERIEY